MINSRTDLSTQNLDQLSDEELFALQQKINAAAAKRAQKTENTDAANKAKLIALTNANRFYAPNTQSATQQAAELLLHVKNADYNEIYRIAAATPSLFFLEVNDLNGKKTTPLKQALYNLDAYTYGAVYHQVKNSPGFLREFVKQALEQQDHIEIKKLSAACTQLSSLCNKFEKMRSYDEGRNLLNFAWSDVTNLQHDLPMHMIREYCRENINVEYHDFTLQTHPAPTGGNVWLDDDLISIDSPEFKSKFGKFGLMHGNHAWLEPDGKKLKDQLKRFPAFGEEVPCYMGLSYHDVSPFFKYGVKEDRDFFQRLYDTRIADLMNMRAEIQKLADQYKISALNQETTTPGLRA